MELHAGDECRTRFRANKIGESIGMLICYSCSDILSACYTVYTNAS